MSVKKYRKKPVEVEAMQVLDDLQVHEQICRWAAKDIPEGNIIPVVMSAFDSHLLIHRLDGTMRAQLGDFIIKGLQGEFYPCKPDIFAATYEEVTE